MQLLGKVASSLSVPALEHGLCVLARLTMDSTLHLAADLIEALFDTFASLVEALPSSGWDESASRTIKVINGYTSHASFQIRLLEQLPAHSPRTHLFRSNLAATCFLDDVSSIRKPSDGPLDLRRLTRRLQKMDFGGRRDTDYVELSATASILDVALDVCIPPTVDDGPDRKRENAFDRKVDELTYLIKSMFSRIPDTGAGHMTRTEAKEVLNRVHFRIAYGVRTRPKPKKNLFETSTVGKVDDGLPKGVHGPMARFLKKKREEKKETE